MEETLRIQSFDIGVRNLGMALTEIRRDASNSRGVRMKVLKWVCLDCCTAAGVPDADVRESTIEGALGICSLAWNRLKHEILPDDFRPDCVFLESQPRFNPKMRHVYTTLQFFLRGQWDERGCQPSFHCVSGGRKLAEADFSKLFAESNRTKSKQLGRRRTTQEKRQDQHKKYNANKKHAKDFAPTILREAADDGERLATWFEEQKGKRDDLADALLQAFYMGKDLVEARASRKCPPKPPRCPIKGVKFKKPTIKTVKSRGEFATEVDEALFEDAFFKPETRDKDELYGETLGPLLRAHAEEKRGESLKPEIDDPDELAGEILGPLLRAFQKERSGGAKKQTAS